MLYKYKCVDMQHLILFQGSSQQWHHYLHNYEVRGLGLILNTNLSLSLAPCIYLFIF